MSIFSYFKVDAKQEKHIYEYRVQLVNVMLVLSIGILAGFAVMHFRTSNISLGLFQAFLSLFYAYTFFDPLKHIQYKHKENTVVLGTTLLYWFLFYDGGIERTGIFWIPFFPFLVFAVSGLQRGKYWVAFFTLGLLLIEAFAYFEMIQLKYTALETIVFFISFLFYALVAALFEALRVRQQNELESRNENLGHAQEILNDTLVLMEQEVAVRTQELKESNVKLSKEIEQHKTTNLELVEAQQKFYQAQKMEALGTLVAGIAHDFNNLLVGINANLFLIQRKIKSIPEVQSPVDDIERMVLHASNMTKQLLTYARKDDVEKEQCNLSLFMQDSLKLLKTTLPSRIKTQINITRTPLPVFVSTTQIQQVMMNLVNNARDALSAQEIPSVYIVVSHLSEALAVRQNHPVEGEHWAYISVQDNGLGIEKSNIGQVFDPFFTTKITGGGTGLGLAMSYGAIQSHGGVIEVESKLKQGTTFHIYLPLVEEKKQEIVQRSVDEALQGRGEMILLVDDDENLCRAQKGVLENLGYQVQVAHQGFEAIKCYAELEIDLVIMDIMMPEMGGIKAAQNMMAMDDAAKIIFASGYDKDSSTERYLSADFAQVENIKRLNKPFTIQQLCQAIRLELDK